MKWVVAALVCVATLAGIDRVFFKGAYVAVLKSGAAESAVYYR